MSEMPHVQPAKPAEPTTPTTPTTPAASAPGTRPALDAVDVVAFLCELFAFFTLCFWGFVAWSLPWNFVVGIGAPVLAILVWALFVSPRAVIRVHPFVRAFVELLVYASATIAWWSLGAPWVGLAFGVVAVATGVISGRRRFA